MIDDIYRNSNPPAAINDFITNLKKLKQEKRYVILPKEEKKILKVKLDAIREQYNKHKQLIGDYFGPDTVHLKYIIFNPATLKRSDKNLYANFLGILKSNDESSFYFQYGRFHSRLVGNSLANRINKTKGYEDKVFTIGSQYNSCDYWFDKIYRKKNFGAISQSSRRVKKAYKYNYTGKTNKVNFIIVDDFIERKTGFRYIIDFNNIEI